MTQSTTVETAHRSYFPKGVPAKILMGISGIVAIIVALKAASYESLGTPMFEQQDHMFRLIAFAALAIWVTFAIGVRRRGAAAIITLVFAVFVELVIAPSRGVEGGTLLSANLGIVLAYCSMHLYWLGIVRTKRSK